MSTLTRIGTKAGEYAVLAAILFFALPYYIDREVDRRMGEIDDAAPEPTPLSETGPIVELSTQIDTLSEGQKRIEDKVDRFADAFIKYLQREAQ